MNTTIKSVSVESTGKSLYVDRSVYASDSTFLLIQDGNTDLAVHVPTSELLAAVTPEEKLPAVEERGGKLWVDGKWVCSADTKLTSEYYEKLADEGERWATRRRAIAAFLRTKQAATKDAEAEAAKQAAYDLRHDELGLEALAQYNESYLTCYDSWEATAGGRGCHDSTVQSFRAKAQKARDAKATTKTELGKLRDEVAREVAAKSGWRPRQLTWTYDAVGGSMQTAVDLIIEARKATK